MNESWEHTWVKCVRFGGSVYIHRCNIISGVVKWIPKKRRRSKSKVQGEHPFVVRTLPQTNLAISGIPRFSLSYIGLAIGSIIHR